MLCFCDYRAVFSANLDSSGPNHIVATRDDKMLIMIPKFTIATAKPARDCNQGERLVGPE